MSYLEKRSWKKANLLHGKRGIQKINYWQKIRSVALIMIFFVAFGVISGKYWNTKTYFNPYKGVIGEVYAAPPGKVLDFRITKRKNFANPVKGIFPLGNSISIVAKGDGEKIGADLDPIRFASYNIGREYLHYPATDWIYLTRMLKASKKMTEVLGGENLAMAFKVIPYRKFKSVSEKVGASNSHMMEPFLNLGKMQGLEHGFDRIFADGHVREIKPNDNWLVLQPNVHRLWRKSDTDLEIGVPSLEPEEALPVALYAFTNLCDWQTGEWDVAQTQWLVSCQYAISYGVYLDPDKIQIVGKGTNVRFLFEEDLEVDMVIVRWSEEQVKPKWRLEEDDPVIDIPVPIVNDRNELCFWGSREPDQSIIIPYSYLPRMELDDPILLGDLSDGAITITLQDILDELQQVRDNRHGRHHVIYADTNGTRSAVGYDLSAYVVKTPRLTKIADRIVADAQTEEGAVENLMAFIAANLPYVSDHKGNKNKPGYNGPLEIPMSPLVALMNRGEDCEGHAISGASYFFTSEHPALKGKNNYCALAALDYGGIGHVVPLLPNIGELVTDPFPNHVLFPIDGKAVPFSYTEPTGFGYNDLHQDKPHKRGYRPEYAMLISGHSSTRRVGTIGFNQFEYLQETN